MKKHTIQDFLEVKSVGSPAINFDGSIVAFVSNVTGTNQIYIVPSKGGTPEQITSYSDAVSGAIFSPKKNEFIFLKDEKGNEQKQIYLYSLETKEIKALTNNPKARHSFGAFSPDGKLISYCDNSRNGTDFDVYTMDLETGKVECICDMGGSLSVDRFSPNMKFVPITKSHGNVSKDLYLLDLATKKVELITPQDGNTFYNGVSWLPDSSGFYTKTNQDRDFTGLSHYDIATKKFTYVLTPNWDIEGSGLSRNGKYLSVIINEDGYDKLKLYQRETLTEVPLKLPHDGIVYAMKMAGDEKHLVMNIGTARHVANIWMYSIDDQKSWQITQNTQSVSAEELVDPELVRYMSFDGLQIPAFVYRPKNIPQGEKVPVIINIHGGPESQATPTLALLTQYFVYHGYAVITPNVRGSSGYGKKYLALDDIEKRLDSVRDLASLHDYIQTTTDLDPTKVALIGGSYGGYMTLAGLAFHPERWVGGVDIVGMSNFVTFLQNTAPYRRALREIEYGFLDKHMDVLKAVSPINHIQNITAPLFVIHGANDPRVPLSEAHQIVDQLAALGRKAELLVYEDEGHGLSKLKNRLDAYPKVLEFFGKVFGK